MPVWAVNSALIFGGFKNHIGVFQQPNAVLIDTTFLATLPERELRSGFAEVIKHCLIADAAKWDEIRRRDLDEQDWTGSGSAFGSR